MLMKFYCDECGCELNYIDDMYICPNCGLVHETYEEDLTPHPIKDFIAWASFGVLIALLWILCYGGGCR